MLAYHAVYLLRRRLGAHGIHDSCETIRRKPPNWVRLATTLVTGGVECIKCRQMVRTVDRMGSGRRTDPVTLLYRAGVFRR